MALTWEDTFKVLREKSTMAGLVGLGVAIAAAAGITVDEGQEAALTELILAIISVVAIATRPKDPPRYGHPETWHDRREDHVGTAGGVGDSDSYFVRGGDLRQGAADQGQATGERN